MNPFCRMCILLIAIYCWVSSLGYLAEKREGRGGLFYLLEKDICQVCDLLSLASQCLKWRIVGETILLAILVPVDVLSFKFYIQTFDL